METWIVVVLVTIVVDEVFRRYYGYPKDFKNRWFHGGTIRGTLFIDGAPAPANTPVAGQYYTCCKGGEYQLGFTIQARTKRNGTFCLRLVPAGEVGVGRLYENPITKTCHIDVMRRVSVTHLKTTEITLGDGAGRITGQLTTPPEAAPVEDWRREAGLWLECLRHNPEVADSDTIREYAGPLHRGVDPETGAPTKDQHSRWYYVPVNEEGRFSLDGVYPGVYGLKMELPQSREWTPDYPLKPMSVGFHVVKIGAGPGESHDLGQVVVPKQCLTSPAPGSIRLEVQNDAGAVPDLAELRCDFWRVVEDQYEDSTYNSCGFFACDSMEFIRDEGNYVVSPVEPGRFSLSFATATRRNLLQKRGGIEQKQVEQDLDIDVLPGQNVLAVLNLSERT